MIIDVQSPVSELSVDSIPEKKKKHQQMGKLPIVPLHMTPILSSACTVERYRLLYTEVQQQIPSLLSSVQRALLKDNNKQTGSDGRFSVIYFLIIRGS